MRVPGLHGEIRTLRDTDEMEAAFAPSRPDRVLVDGIGAGSGAA